MADSRILPHGEFYSFQESRFMFDGYAPCVYLIRDACCNLLYIGKTHNLNQRLLLHNQRSAINRPMSNYMRINGVDDLLVEVLPLEQIERHYRLRGEDALSHCESILIQTMDPELNIIAAPGPSTDEPLGSPDTLSRMAALFA